MLLKHKVKLCMKFENASYSISISFVRYFTLFISFSDDKSIFFYIHTVFTCNCIEFNQIDCVQWQKVCAWNYILIRKQN